MNFSNYSEKLKLLFKYVPKNDNFFTLPNGEDSEYNDSTNSSDDTFQDIEKYKKVENIFPTLSINLEYVKMK